MAKTHLMMYLPIKNDDFPTNHVSFPGDYHLYPGYFGDFSRRPFSSCDLVVRVFVGTDVFVREVQWRFLSYPKMKAITPRKI